MKLRSDDAAEALILAERRAREIVDRRLLPARRRRERTGLWEGAHPPEDPSDAPAAPTDHAAGTFQAAPRLATYQPTHESLPAEILKTLAP